MDEKESIIKKCQECIDSGKPAMDYSFYYRVIELLKEQQETITSLQSTISKLYDLLNDVCKEFRAETLEDCVCGLCQYDGAYKGSSGDWCNECPGFELSDCFTMKNEIRKMCGKDLLPEP